MANSNISPIELPGYDWYQLLCPPIYCQPSAIDLTAGAARHRHFDLDDKASFTPDLNDKRAKLLQRQSARVRPLLSNLAKSPDQTCGLRQIPRTAGVAPAGHDS
jgi:hypothetical protein